jgi:hypothetical protein
MSNTIPPMRGAGEVAPLPRGRAPHGTSQHSLSQQPPPARMKTASPARGTTIPPIASRPTRPSLPPPRPSSTGMPIPRTSTSSMPALRNTPRATLPPSTMPSASPFEAVAEVSPFDVQVDVSPFAAEPQGFPVVKQPRPPSSVDMTADVIKGDNWFDVSAKVEKLHEETWVGSTDRTSRKRELARMLVVPAIIAASIGVAVGVYISYRGGSKPTPHASTTPSVTTPAVTPEPMKQIEMPVTSTAPDPNAESPNAATASAGGDQPQPPTKEEDAAKQQEAAALAVAHADDPAAEPSLTRDAPINGAAQPAVAANAPAVQEIKTTSGIIKLVDVRINSKPAGATVMLVDDGKTSFLGTTPLATSVDASKSYDVILTLEGRPTQMAHLDPATSARVDISLPRAHHESKAAPAAPLADVVAKPAVVEKKAVAEKKAVVEKQPEAKKPDAKKATKASSGSFDEEAELASLGLAPKKADKPKADAGGEGTLMVSSKPPCEIYIDGKATGLTTPQRSIALSAGSHKITFINAAENIKKTVSVSITADKPTKLIQDLMAK